MQATGIEFEAPEGVETGICHEGECHHGGDNAIVDTQDGVQSAVVAPEGDQCDEERQDEEVETGGEVERQTVNNHSHHVADAKGVTLIVDQHKHQLGGDKDRHRQHIHLDQIY